MAAPKSKLKDITGTGSGTTTARSKTATPRTGTTAMSKTATPRTGTMARSKTATPRTGTGSTTTHYGGAATERYRRPDSLAGRGRTDSHILSNDFRNRNDAPDPVYALKNKPAARAKKKV